MVASAAEIQPYANRETDFMTLTSARHPWNALSLGMISLAMISIWLISYL